MSVTGKRIGYRTLLTGRGRKAMVYSGGVSRLPLTGAGVAIVLGVGSATGSYFVAGSAAAAFVIAAAVCAPVLARLMDVIGQRRVLSAAALVQAVAFTSLALACLWVNQPALLVGLSAMAGLVGIDIGSAMRSRWAAMLVRDEAKRVAFMLEAFVDEAMFIVTPLAVTSAALLHPTLGIFVVALGPTVGWTSLALQGLTAPRPAPRASRARRSRAVLNRPDVRRLLIAFVGFGAYLGSIEVLLVASADRVGRPLEAGIALAGWGAGSALAALVLGPRIGRVRPARVLLAGAVVMSGFGIMLSLGEGLMWLTAVCFLAGIGAAPALSAGFSMAGNAVGADQRTEAMTWMTTGLGLGTTIGALSGGFVADRIVTQEAYIVSSSIGICSVFAALWVARSMTLSGNSIADDAEAGSLQNR